MHSRTLALLVLLTLSPAWTADKAAPGRDGKPAAAAPAPKSSPPRPKRDQLIKFQLRNETGRVVMIQMGKRNLRLFPGEVYTELRREKETIKFQQIRMGRYRPRKGTTPEFLDDSPRVKDVMAVEELTSDTTLVLSIEKSVGGEKLALKPPAPKPAAEEDATASKN